MRLIRGRGKAAPAAAGDGKEVPQDEAKERERQSPVVEDAAEKIKEEEEVDSDDESGSGGSHHQWSFPCRLCSCHGDGRTSVQVLFHHDVVCTCLDSVCNDKDTLKINPETVIHSAL